MSKRRNDRGLWLGLVTRFCALLVYSKRLMAVEHRRGGTFPPFTAGARSLYAVRSCAGRALPLPPLWLFVWGKYSAVAGLVRAFGSWKRCM